MSRRGKKLVLRGARPELWGRGSGPGTASHGIAVAITREASSDSVSSFTDNNDDDNDDGQDPVVLSTLMRLMKRKMFATSRSLFVNNMFCTYSPLHVLWGSRRHLSGTFSSGRRQHDRL